jgi:hypothetical protein
VRVSLGDVLLAGTCHDSRRDIPEGRLYSAADEVRQCAATQARGSGENRDHRCDPSTEGFGEPTSLTCLD